MKYTRQLFSYTMIAFILLLPLQATAGPAEDYQEARLLYLTAAASLAAYSGGDGDIIMTSVDHDGWKIVPYIKKDEIAQAKFFFARKQSPPLPAEYLLAISGTSTRKDIELDFKIGRVYFAGKTFDEFEKNAEIKMAIPDQVPMVHKGFHQYIQNVFSAETEESVGGKPGRKIVNLLLEHPESIVYLAGHSTGGSAAVLLGARLIDMGVKSDRLKIVTFGAPTVGNTAFAEKYSLNLNLIRVVVAGDPIPGLLNVFAHGYRQFGREIRWVTSGYTFDEKHYPTIYLDCAIKNYYDKRGAAINAGVQTAYSLNEKPSLDGRRLYIADIKNNLPKELDGEFSYMREVLLDQYRDTLPAYVVGKLAASEAQQFEALRAQAAAANCDRMVIANIWGSKQDDPAIYGGGLLVKPVEPYDLIVIEQAVFRVSDGVLLDARTYQKGSKYFTPLVALASAAITLADESTVSQFGTVNK